MRLSEFTTISIVREMDGRASAARRSILKSKKMGVVHGCETSFLEYTKNMLCLKTQALGTYLESHFRSSCGMHRVHGKEHGDCQDSAGACYEIKTSILNSSNDTLNMLQIRQNQIANGVGLIAIAVDLRDENRERVIVFKLSPEDVSSELLATRANAIHGTKAANKKNKNIELAMRIKMNENNKDYLRWQKYRNMTMEAQLTRPC